MSLTQVPFKDLVSEWFDRYEMADFDRFIYLWISFNAWLARESNENTDRDMIDWFKENYNHTFEKARESNPEMCEAIDWFIENGIKNMKTKGIYKPASDEDFENIVEVIYQVRCNLFHGSKSRDAAIDRQAVANATTLLDGIYRPLLLADRNFKKHLRASLFQQSINNV